MTLRVLLVEDERPAREAMRTLLAADPDLEVVGEAWGPGAVPAIRRLRPDLALVDVEMPVLDGFGVLESLDADELPLVIFVTAHDHYALRAFDVRAVDYVLKPFTDERFRAALVEAKRALGDRRAAHAHARLLRLVGETARERAAGSPPVAGSVAVHDERLVVRDGARIIVVPVSEVSWLEAAGVYVRIHRAGSSVLVRASLNELVAGLERHGFFRIHRSAAISLARVREVRPLSHGDGLVMLDDGTELKVSRSRREDFEQALAG